MTSIKPHLLPFIVVVLGVAILFGKVAYSPYFLVDETEYIKIHQPNLPYFSLYGESSAVYAYFLEFEKKYFNLGRYKPLGVALQWGAAKIFGDKLWVLKLMVLLLAVFSCFGFYLFLLGLKLKKLVAVTGSIFLLTGAYSEVWFRLGPYEGVGVLVLIYGLYAYQCYVCFGGKKYRYAALVLLVLSFHIKESFAALIPVLMLIQWWLWVFHHSISWKESFTRVKKDFLLLLFGFVAFCVGLFFVYSKANMLYGIESNYSIVTIMWHNTQQIFAPNYLLVFVLPLLYFYRQRKDYIFVAVLIGLFCWSGQLLVNINNWMLPSSRYVMIGQLPILFFALLGINQLWINDKRYKVITVVLVVLVMLYNSKNAYTRADYYYARCASIQNAITYVAENPNKKTTLFLVPLGEELVQGAGVLLSTMGYNKKMDHRYIQTKQRPKWEEKTPLYFKQWQHSVRPNELNAFFGDSLGYDELFLFLEPLEEWGGAAESLPEGIWAIAFSNPYNDFSFSAIKNGNSFKKQSSLRLLYRK